MSVHSRFHGKQTQFYIEILYGVLFVGGFAVLVFQFDPRLAAFEGGLVVGYLLRVWEKMSIYERIIEQAVSAEAETQVADEVDEQVAEQVEEQMADEVSAEVEDTVEETVAAEVSAEVEETVADELPAEVEERVAAEMADIDEEIDERVEEHVEDAGTESS